MDRRETARELYRQAHMKMGLCIKCPNKATKPPYCAKHWKKKISRRVENVRRQRLERAKLGLCVGCGNQLDPEVDDHYKCCWTCRTHRGKRLC